MALRMLGVDLLERVLASLSDDMPSGTLLCIEVDASASVKAGKDRVLRMLHGGRLRCFGRAIASLDRKTLLAGGYQR